MRDILFFLLYCFVELCAFVSIISDVWFLDAGNPLSQNKYAYLNQHGRIIVEDSYVSRC